MDRGLFLLLEITMTAREMFDEFLSDPVSGYCWICGIPDGTRPKQSPDYPRWLERHHIIRGPGRVHDRRNICSLCKLCHDLHHGHTIRLNGKPLPAIRLDHILWAKHRHDKPLDRRFLRSLSIKNFLPACRVPPLWHQRQRDLYGIRV